MEASGALQLVVVVAVVSKRTTRCGRHGVWLEYVVHENYLDDCGFLLGRCDIVGGGEAEHGSIAWEHGSIEEA